MFALYFKNQNYKEEQELKRLQFQKNSIKLSTIFFQYQILTFLKYRILSMSKEDTVDA